MTERQFKDIVEQATYYGYAVGLRGQDVEFPEVGECIDHQSSDWTSDEFDESDEQYDGICTVSLMSSADVEYAFRAFNIFGRTNRAGECRYVYDHVAIVAGNFLCDGADEGEIVISDAEVAGIVS